MRKRNPNADRYRRDEVDGILEAVNAVMEKHVHLDHALQRVMRGNKGWDNISRRLVATSVIDIVRYFRLYSVIAGSETVTRYNIFHFLAASIVRRDRKIPFLPPFKKFEESDLKRAITTFQKDRKIAESYPDWLYDLGKKQLGKRWDSLANALNDEPQVVLRANTLKISSEELAARLEEQNVEAEVIRGFPEAVLLKRGANVFRLPEFKEGLFEVQDPASQMVSVFLEVQPGMRVVDACAGTGGKSLHIASLMKNKGKIIALDTIPGKLEDLRKRASRAGAHIIEAREIDSTKTIKRLYETADRVLLDVPCSGTGVIRRNPDSKWSLTIEELKELQSAQQRILQQYAPIVKPGGRIVYSTCSVLPSESEQQVQDFLKANKEYALEGERRFWTDRDNTDTFYIAVLSRKKKLAKDHISPEEQ